MTRADWTQHDSPRRSMERQRARKLYEEDQIVTIWTDASVSPERSAIAVARAYPPAVLVARRTRAKSALKAEREALREGVSHAVAHIEAGKADRVIVRFDAPRAENGIGIPHPLQTRVELQHRLGVYNLAHSPATHHQRRLVGGRNGPATKGDTDATE